MRDRWLLFVFFLITGAVFLLSPLDYVLTKKGLLENQNVGNVIQVEKHYDEDSFAADFLNRAEQVKRDIRDVYTNYIPGFLPIISASKVAQQELNRPLDGFLLQRGNAALTATETPAPAAVPEESPAAEAESEAAAQSGTAPLPEETPAPTPEPTPEPTPALPHEDPLIDRAEVIFRGGNSNRYYEIRVTDPEGGEQIDFYVRIPSPDQETLRPQMERQAAAFNRIAEEERVQLYLYPVTCFEDTVLCDRLIPADSKSALFSDFRTLLDERILFGCLHLDTLQEKQELFWATDHHWNYRGYAQGYADIVRLFQQRYPDIVPLEPVYTVYEGVDFYGTNALHLGRTQLADTFGVALYDLPEHELIREPGVNYGGWDPIETVKDRYDRGEVHREVGYEHYIDFFRIAKEIRYPENHFGRNLLLICDSYSPPLMEALASHFDSTYVRYVDQNSNLPRWTVEDYVTNCGVTDVLVLEGSVRVIYDFYGDSLKNIMGLEGG